ncbi:MAG: bifunctional GNAT family N-acetyltransferase/carbon-nitrogen hydrolase family protein [Cyclobacteriaceae bacterium]|nr:bifunctional GNAT family N-acetyltransferase/carbon-nitrogen hydrolase family protein [Cyclobacteriaceae bacterium]
MKVEITHLTMSDYLDLKESMLEAYTQWGAYWRDHQIEKLLKLFPEGQLCIKVDDKLVGAALSLIVDYNKLGDNHTYKDATSNYTFDSHTPNGDVLYGIEVFIHPEHRGLRLGRRMYDARKELCEKFNLRAIIAGARLPRYGEHAEELSPKEYIEKVKNKELYDPTLSFQLNNGFHVRKILKGYMPGDTESRDYAALIEWINIYYESNKKLLNQIKTNVRLSLVQWQMRNFKDFESLCEQIEFFVDAASAYEADFILFPEFFHAPLMAEYNHLTEAEAIRGLAKYTEPLRQRFAKLAVSYNANIITGSFPDLRDGKLYNVGYLCHRNGKIEEFQKIHITPGERESWGMVGGDLLKTFNTDCGKVGVLICYDVEFPELSRLLADEGMNILFVPFLTDTQNAYSRVRHCSQARAIENECFVAIAGCVGNLPKVNNMDIQYAQSAVFTPCDFAFPTNGVKAEATPNTEMTLIVDVDLDLLKDLNHKGSVTNLRDRRKDLYRMEAALAKRSLNELEFAVN